MDEGTYTEQQALPIRRDSLGRSCDRCWTAPLDCGADGVGEMTITVHGTLQAPRALIVVSRFPAGAPPRWPTLEELADIIQEVASGAVFMLPALGPDSVSGPGDQNVIEMWEVTRVDMGGLAS